MLHGGIKSIERIDKIGKLAEEIEVSASSERDAARVLVIKQSVAWRFVFFFPFRAKTISTYERTSEHYVYGAVSFLPTLESGRWQKGHLFESLFAPVITTFSRDNVHPAGLLFMYKEGAVLLPLHKALPEEIEKLANYLYFIDAAKSVGPPDPEEAQGGFDIDVLPRDRMFTDRERKFYKLIKIAGEQIDTNNDMKSLFDYVIHNAKSTQTRNEVTSYLTMEYPLALDSYVVGDIIEFLLKLPVREV